MEERRLLMAVALSLLLLTAYSLLFPPARPSPTPSPSAPAGAAAVSPAPPRDSAPPERAREAAVVPAGPAVADERERRVEARSRELSVAFTNRGARLVSWRLARFADGRGSMGIIPTVTEPFCATCNRIRLTADGKFRHCLFAIDETDLKTPMRAGASDEELGWQMVDNVQRKWPGHLINQAEFVKPARNMSQIGG